jgi:hypothetical protein
MPRSKTKREFFPPPPPFLDEIDVECRELVRILNLVPGVYTRESCSGHDRDYMRIWFEASNTKSLSLLSHFTASAHTTLEQDWTIVVRPDCFLRNPKQPMFMLKSASRDLLRNHAEAISLVDAIGTFLIENNEAGIMQELRMLDLRACGRL